MKTKVVLEDERQAALAKIQLLRDAWKNGDPGEAMSPRRWELIHLQEQGYMELARVNRERRRLMLLRRNRTLRRWLKGLPKKQVNQILVWTGCQ